MMGPFRDQKWFGIACVVLCALAVGCRRAEVSTEPPLTSSEVRADRRAFDGAPPVIPHAPLGANCTTCHNKTGMPVPSMAYAPANPHATGGRFTNCRQCHVFQQSTELFAETDFSPLLVSGRQGDRLFPGAPPTIPHATLMRENFTPRRRPRTARSKRTTAGILMVMLTDRMSSSYSSSTSTLPSKSISTARRQVMTLCGW